MERAQVLHNFSKDGLLPVEWEVCYPVQARLAQRMVLRDDTARPSCGQVLGELLREGLWCQPEQSPVQK